MICSFKQQTLFPRLKYCNILCWHNIPWEIITSRANLVYITVFNERICLWNVSRLKFFRTFISVGPIAFIEIWTVVIRNIEQRCSKNKFMIDFLMVHQVLYTWHYDKSFYRYRYIVLVTKTSYMLVSVEIYLASWDKLNTMIPCPVGALANSLDTWLLL